MPEGLSGRADARKNRQRIIEAAEAVFRERGLAAEMKEIAERAGGVGMGTIYRNYPSKQDLILAIVGSAVDETLSATPPVETFEDPIEGLRSLLIQELTLTERLGWLREATSQAQYAKAGSQVRGALQEFKKSRPIEVLLRRAVQIGALEPDLDITVAAAMLGGLTTTSNWRPLLAGRGPEDLADAVLDLFLSGSAND